MRAYLYQFLYPMQWPDILSNDIVFLFSFLSVNFFVFISLSEVLLGTYMQQAYIGLCLECLALGLYQMSYDNWNQSWSAVAVVRSVRLCDYWKLRENFWCELF